MQQPIIKECFADNGEHSHWELINSETGEKLWTEEEKEDNHIPVMSKQGWSFMAKLYRDKIMDKAGESDLIRFIGETVIDVDDLRDILNEPIIDKPEYLLCSAIRRVEERDCQKVYWPKYQDIYKIELGWRHPDIMHRFGQEVSRNPNDQGFYTCKGRFVTREEVLEIARAAGQVDKIIGGVLTSEDLY